MAHYVISDIHGDSRRFHQMLDTIQFSEADTLYILGDVVDRGPEPIPVLQEIMHSPNMVMLLGNHEHMCLQCYRPTATELDYRRWNLNNNYPTIAGIEALQQPEREELFAFLESLPIHLELEVEGTRFYLVHGFPGETLHDEVWGRPAPSAPNPVPGARVIVGHTPVCCLGRSEAEEEEFCYRLNVLGEHMKIFHGEGFLDIDCCCGYDIPAAALACIRLEDLEEFYVR